MKNIKRFFGPAGKEPGYIIRSIVSRSIFSGYTVANIFIVQQIVKTLETNSVAELPKWMIVYGVGNVVYFIGTIFIRHWGWAESNFQYQAMIHQEYIDKFNSLDNTYSESIGTGKIISIVGKGIDTWVGLLTDIVGVSVRLIFSLTAAFIVLAQFGSFSVVIFIILFIVVHIVVYRLNLGALESRKGRTDTMNEYDRQLVKIIMSKFEILQNDKISREIGVLTTYSNTAKMHNIRLNNYLFAMFSLPNIIFFIITFSALVLVAKFHLALSILISLFMMLSFLKASMEDSIDFFKQFTKQSYIIQKMWMLFDDAPKLEGLDTGRNFIFQNGSIELKNLSFSYGESSVFDSFNLAIDGQKKTTLVGLSGCGKSTLIKLIAGYLRPKSGSILVDGQDLQEVKLKEYYAHIGYLTQDPSVFDGTILENLTYGAKRDVSEAELQDAIKLAECDFIYSFKEGINTEIGEKGVRLSGGQKQRLAIAKIFIKNPEIILLDEPTSALDSFSEEKINIAFHNLFKGRTVIVIAHRLQTVKEADDIIVLEAGKIIERGNHTSLTKKKGVYAKMLELQSGF